MFWHDLIFSDRPAKRLQRHLAFWMLWWLYLSLCEYLYQIPIPEARLQPFYVTVGPLPFVKTFLLVFVYAGAYYALNIILQGFAKKNPFKAVSLSLLVACLLYLVVYFLFWSVFPTVDSLSRSGNIKSYPERFWPVISLGLIAPIKLVASAATVSYLKRWWLRQKESEQLTREKIAAELELHKLQIQPGILFSALNRLYDYSKQGSRDAAELLLKLSDLLSYMLYECDADLVDLEKEIELLKGYIAMEELRQSEPIEMEVNVKSDIGGKMIAPFLLLPFLENSFRYCVAGIEQAWINIDISVEGDFFIMKIAHSLSPEDQQSSEILPGIGLANVTRRLNLLYPQQYELKLAHEQEMLVTFLRIPLKAAGKEPAKKEQSETATSLTTQPKMYVAQP